MWVNFSVEQISNLLCYVTLLYIPIPTTYILVLIVVCCVWKGTDK